MVLVFSSAMEITATSHTSDIPAGKCSKKKAPATADSIRFVISRRPIEAAIAMVVMTNALILILTIFLSRSPVLTSSVAAKFP